MYAILWSHPYISLQRIESMRGGISCTQGLDELRRFHNGGGHPRPTLRANPSFRYGIDSTSVRQFQLAVSCQNLLTPPKGQQTNQQTCVQGFTLKRNSLIADEARTRNNSQLLGFKSVFIVAIHRELLRLKQRIRSNLQVDRVSHEYV